MSKEDHASLEGTNNRDGTDQYRWTNDYIKASFEASIWKFQQQDRIRTHIKISQKFPCKAISVLSIVHVHPFHIHI